MQVQGAASRIIALCLALLYVAAADSRFYGTQSSHDESGKPRRFSYNFHGEDWKVSFCKGKRLRQSPIALPWPLELLHHANTEVGGGYGTGYQWYGSDSFAFNYDWTELHGGPTASHGYIVGEEEFGWNGSTSLTLTPTERNGWLGKLWIHGWEYRATSIRIRGPAEHFYMGAKMRFPLEIQIVHELWKKRHSERSPYSKSGHHTHHHKNKGHQSHHTHYPHKTPKDDTVVLSLFIAEGKHSKPVQSFIEACPHPKPLLNHTRQFVPYVKFSVRELIGDGPLVAYSYSGSSTTPPCEENVHWLIVGTPFEASEGQVKELRWLLESEDGYNNWRYTQNLHNTKPIKMKAAIGSRLGY